MNVSDAQEEGATKDEILETAVLAVSMCGGPKMMYMKYVYDALDLSMFFKYGIHRWF